MVREDLHISNDLDSSSFRAGCSNSTRVILNQYDPCAAAATCAENNFESKPLEMCKSSLRLTGPFGRLGPIKALVIGDLLLDTYTIGKARRISPEAPVAVVNVQREESRAGGAGNVILNLLSLGAQVSAIGRIGNDNGGMTLRQCLVNEGVDCRGIVVQSDYPTPVKNRIIAENQQVVRIDHEKIVPTPADVEQQIIKMLPELLEGVQVIAISDYGKGFLTATLLQAIIHLGRQANLCIIADPKGIDFAKYSGVSIIKPNLGETYAAAGLPSDAPLEAVAQKVLTLANADTLMVTRSEAGISLFSKEGTHQNFPVRAREVKDVTGAGDTVLAMLACALANGLSLAEAAQLCNLAAGIAIEHFGCARVTLSQLARRLLELDVANKVFDEEHLFALRHALQGKKCTILGLSSAQGLTSRIYQSIRLLSLQKETNLIIYLRDEVPDDEFVHLLASLHEIDFIVLRSDSLQNLCNHIEPHQIYVLDNADCRKVDAVHEILT